MSNNQTNFDPIQADEDLDFIVKFQNRHGAPLVIAYLPKIITALGDEALLNPYFPVNEKNIETYKKEYRLSIKLKRFMAYGVVLSILLLILAWITNNTGFFGDLINTLWTAAGSGTIVLYLFYRFMLSSKFEEYVFDPGTLASVKESKLSKNIKKQNETVKLHIESREKIESNLANFESELKEYIKHFEKKNELVTLSWKELGAKKVFEEMNGNQA